MQKYIVLTGHITDALLTIVGGPTWNKLSDADKKIFEEVLKEAAARATSQIVEIEAKLGAEFAKRGKEVVKVDRTPFRNAVGEDAQRARRDLGQGDLRQAAGLEVVRNVAAADRAPAAAAPGSLLRSRAPLRAAGADASSST